MQTLYIFFRRAPKYFILFRAIVGGIIFLIFSSCSLLAYRDTTEFFVLLTYILQVCKLTSFSNFCFAYPLKVCIAISSCLQTEMVLFLVSKLYGFYFLLTYCPRWPFFSTMLDERDENRAKSSVTITVLLFVCLFFNIYVMQAELISIMLLYWPLWFGSRTCLNGCDLEEQFFNWVGEYCIQFLWLL